jgi:YtkA-like
MRLLRRHLAGPLAATVACCATTVVAAAPAAPDALKIRPRVAATVATNGSAKTLIVRVRDKSGKPIARARVTASADMFQPHIMIFPPLPLKEGPAGTYRTRYDFLMAGLNVKVRVSGANVVTTVARFRASASVPPRLFPLP